MLIHGTSHPVRNPNTRTACQLCLANFPVFPLPCSQSHTQTKGFQMFLFHKLSVTEINCVREYELQSETYFSAPWPSNSLAILNCGLPFFPIKCFLSSSLNLYFRYILLHISNPFISRSFPSSTSLSFYSKTLKISFLDLLLIHSHYIRFSFHF